MSARLYQPSEIRRVMAAHGLHFTKSLGQNFLTDGNVVRRIVDTAGIGPEDVVLEIGPGIGTLTEELLARAGHVISVELDHTLIPVLQDLFGTRENFTLVEGDALKVDLADVVHQVAAGRPLHVVANVPYYITTPLLTRFLSDALAVHSITILVQKEVAERITAKPGSKVYGALSLLVALHGQATYAFTVPRTVFLPQPKVDSAVVHIVRFSAGDELAAVEGGSAGSADDANSAETGGGLTGAALSPETRTRVNDVIRQVFAQRRKVLAKTLSRATGAPPEEIRTALTELGQPPTARPENLSITDFLVLLDKVGYIEVCNGLSR